MFHFAKVSQLWQTDCFEIMNLNISITLLKTWKRWWHWTNVHQCLFLTSTLHFIFLGMLWRDIFVQNSLDDSLSHTSYTPFAVRISSHEWENIQCQLNWVSMWSKFDHTVPNFSKGKGVWTFPCKSYGKTWSEYLCL